MAKAIRSYSNADQVKELALLKKIKVEQNFGQQVYANFKSLRFGIEACCFTTFEQSVVRKDICDWQNSASNKTVVSTGQAGVFVEPLAINKTASMSCPETPTNVCTIIDLEELIKSIGTYTECFSAEAQTWTITHNLGKFPSVSVVDTQKTVYWGNVEYINSNQLKVTFSAGFAGQAFLN